MNLRHKIAQTLAAESGIAWEDMPDVTETESMPGKDWCYRSADAILAAVAEALTSEEIVEEVAKATTGPLWDKLDVHIAPNGDAFDEKAYIREQVISHITAALTAASITKGDE